MKTGSSISKLRRAPERSVTKPGSASRTHKKRDPQWYDCIAPPKARRRKREARRWLDLLTMRTTNGLPRNRWPGQRLLSVSESSEIFHAALANLKVRDPELDRAVREVIFEDNIADLGLSLAEWKIRALTESGRIERLRVALRPGASE